MPKVKITDAKGLVQETGTGVEATGTVTLSGKVNFDGPEASKRATISRSDLGGGSGFFRKELSGSDTGKTWVLGDNGRGANWFVHLPTASVGFTARFILTGALTAASPCILTGSYPTGSLVATTTDANKSNTPFAVRIIDFSSNSATAGGITGTSGLAGAGAASALSATACTFVAATALAGDFVDVEVISAGVVKITGAAST